MGFREKYLKAVSNSKCHQSFGDGYNFAKLDFKNQLPKPYEHLIIYDNARTFNIYDIDTIENVDYKKGYNAALRDIHKLMRNKRYDISHESEQGLLPVINDVIYKLKKSGFSQGQICDMLGIKSEEYKRYV